MALTMQDLGIFDKWRGDLNAIAACGQVRMNAHPTL
jgi:hypothetical protein